MANDEIGDLPFNDGRAEGERLRDEALERLEEKYEDWISEALQVIQRISKAMEFFTTDDVWFQIKPPVEPRALGAAMRIAHRRGLCEPTARVENSTRRKCHARPVRIWQSLPRMVEEEK